MLDRGDREVRLGSEVMQDREVRLNSGVMKDREVRRGSGVRQNSKVMHPTRRSEDYHGADTSASARVTAS
jgi:hypothetical protein